MKNLRILVVDDEESIRHMLGLMLRAEGWHVHSVGDGEAALTEIVAHPYDLVLCDIRMPRLAGIEFLAQLKARPTAPTAIMMSAFGNRDLAIACLKAGAYDYIDKPFKKDEIVLTILKAAERLALVRENRTLRAASAESDFEGIIGQSKAMQDIYQLVRKVAEHKTTVLITGESGTGKELVARAIHKLSAREKRPWIPVNCGAITENLLESELFGHVKGAFTDAVANKKGLFEEAHQGTIFLDEIAELPLNLQVKLLRVLQEGELRRVGESRTTPVDVRVVAATHHDLGARVSGGLFREDLFYRINVVQIHMPSLRERKEDIARLVERFIAQQNARLGTKVQGVAPGAMKMMLEYDWPGNVRELQNCIERGVVLASGELLDESVLPRNVQRASDAVFQLFDSDETSIKKMTVQLEKLLIQRALARTAGNRTWAARLLELSHRALLYKIKAYGLEAGQHHS